MAKRVSDEIDGVDIFTYDTDLLAAAQELRKPELLELAKRRNYPGLWKLNKLELAIIYADTLTAERDEQRSPLDACEHGTAPQNFCQGCFDTKSAYAAQVDKVRAIRARVVEAAHAEAIEMDERRTIARAYLCTPTGVVLTWDEIQRGYLDAMAERDRIEHSQAVRAQTERDELIAKGRKLGLTAAQLLRDTDDLRATIELVSEQQHGRLISLPAPADAPRDRRSAPAYAVGDRVRWTEDRRLMFVLSVTPTGAYVAPTMDGPLAAFAASEDLSPASKAARLQVFTAGELYAAPEMPKANVVLNLATLLDDPARRLPARLVRTDGTHPEVFSFVFASDGAEQIFAETVHYLGGLIQRGPVVLLVLCRGGKHRSVAFGDAIARHFGAPVTHFHKDLVPYGTVSK